MAKGGLKDTLANDPATKALIAAGTKFAVAKGESLVGKTADKIADTGSGNPIKNAKAGAKAGALKGGIAGALKGLFKKKGGNKRPTNIYESYDIGVARETAWAGWVDQMEEFPNFMKGPEKVQVDEPGEPPEDSEDSEDSEEAEKMVTNWTAKIFLSRRSWKSTVEEFDPPHRIRWSTEAPKGSIEGVITFHAVTEDLTKMVIELEYRSKGPMEWIGNRWRAVGRRVRLDVKHYIRNVMMQELEDQDQEDQDQDPESDELDEQPDDESGEATDEADGEEGDDEEA